MPFRGMARGTLSGSIWRNKTQEAPRTAFCSVGLCTRRLGRRNHLSIRSRRCCSPPFGLYATFRFVSVLTALFIITSVPRTLHCHCSKVLANMSLTSTTFQKTNNISSILIPNADTEMPEIQYSLEGPRNSHLKSSRHDTEPPARCCTGKCSKSYASPRGCDVQPGLVPPSGDPSPRQQDGSISHSLAACTWSSSRTCPHVSSRP